jgi:hypothetical protein
MASMENLLEQINGHIETFRDDSALHNEKGNKAAGARARKASLQLTKLFKEYRKLSVA